MPLAFPSWEGLGVGSSCLLPLASCLLPAPCSRLDAVAHGGNPQDRAASLLPTPCFLKKIVPHLI
ncbi:MULTISPECIES: hypothetical protein [unclassified Moorena]|uniref:hypothetical protein n=1 Tax=unclassified Moorena TaxID=2683338 RepID=UPI0013B8E14C|nr:MULTISPECIES: hypothetical protein [unclassified Moorena]NEQ04753.1 hypothetical protein [Moorena sp. SIO4E2]NEQ12434.1 hypothetical protein [Moorena sp. SIO3E2]NES41266.1 hypothetical protein [Moorena sp. SIO2C4]